MARRYPHACLAILLMTAPALAPPAQAEAFAGSAGLLFGSWFWVDCTKTTEPAPLAGGMESQGVLRLELLYAGTGGSGPWTVTCRAEGAVSVLGHDGLLRDVSLRSEPESRSSSFLLGRCSYDGVFQRGCEATYLLGGAPVHVSTALPGLEPVYARACVGPWVVADNVPSFDPAGVLDRVEARMGISCQTVRIREEPWAEGWGGLAHSFVPGLGA